MSTSIFSRCAVAVLAVMGCSLVGAETSATTPAPALVISVRQHGAIPNDGIDDTDAILQALAYLKSAQGASRKLTFEAGRYDLRAEGFRFDDMDDLTIEGAVDSDGKPSTRLVRHHDLLNRPNTKPIPYLMIAGGCNRLTIRNLLFDNDPQFTTAGEVVEVSSESVIVRILDGLPRVDGMGAYCMNAWDLKTRRLKHQGSLTFGNDVDKNLKELSWYSVGDDASRLMRMNSAKIASQVKVGDGLSWHAGFNGVQTLFGRCNDLRLSNLWTVNAIGFAMESQHCRNITADRVMIRPENNQLAVSSRDGWKLYACSGNVAITGMHVEGVRWDGQNVHGRFLKVVEQNSPNQVIVRHTAKVITPGSVVTFWEGLTQESRTVTACENIKGTFTLRITLDGPVPDFVKKDMRVSVYDWDIGHYELKDCTFRAIAGCASILRNSHALIENCTYDNIMYPAIFVGASLVEAEGVSPHDVTIRNSTFIDSGWIGRQGANGMVAARTWGSDLPLMGTIKITGNTFRDADLGINIFGIDKVIIDNNRFERVTVPYLTDKSSVNQVNIKP